MCMIWSAKPATLLTTSITLFAFANSAAAARGGPPLPGTAPLHGYACNGAVAPLLPDVYSGLHATLEGGASTGSTGAFGLPGDEALLLDGVDARAFVASTPLLAKRPNSTLSAWFHAFAGGTLQYAIYSERDGCQFNVFWVGVERRPGVAPGLSFGIFDGPGCGVGGGMWHVLTSPIEPAPGAWHHVAAVLDETSGMKLYLDGVLVGSNAWTSPWPGSSGGPSTIGHLHVPGHPSFWPGALDDVALFPRALDPGEIGWLATHSLAEIPPNDYDVACAGDGAGSACPCGNESAVGHGEGCRNSTGSAGVLRAQGYASVGADTLSLGAWGLPSTASGIFFQGTDPSNGGAGTVLGDGLLCVGGSIVRLATKFASGGQTHFPQPGDPLVSVRGAVPVAGATRHYQFWYRNAANFCTSATFNYTNSVVVTWSP